MAAFVFYTNKKMQTDILLSFVLFQLIIFVKMLNERLLISSARID